MTLEQLVAQHDSLDLEVNAASDHLNNIVKGHEGQMGLVDDAFRATSEYREANSNFHRAFNALRSFNQEANKNKELRSFLDTRSRDRRFNKA